MLLCQGTFPDIMWQANYSVAVSHKRVILANHMGPSEGSRGVESTALRIGPSAATLRGMPELTSDLRQQQKLGSCLLAEY